jgi:periplasmic divalent cation tolerance protein
MDLQTEFVAVLVTAGSDQEAETIASRLVEERLAACVNIVGPIRSVYRWEEGVQRDEERLLIIKTLAQSYPEVERRVRQLHSYTTPEVIALPIVAGSDAYLGWLRLSTG